MRIGYSTGAVAFGDFQLALRRLRPFRLNALELSALRGNELDPLVSALDSLDLADYEYISFHAPSKFDKSDEAFIVRRLKEVAARGWPIICHPDAIMDHSLWSDLGRSLCFENMDKRKPVGRTVEELNSVFSKFPDAGFCLDLGHAWQIDRTMSEARQMIRRYRSRIRQIHISEVNTKSEHMPLSIATTTAFLKVAQHLPEEAPCIIESVIPMSGDIGREIRFVKEFFEQQAFHLISD